MVILHYSCPLADLHPARSFFDASVRISENSGSNALEGKIIFVSDFVFWSQPIFVDFHMFMFSCGSSSTLEKKNWLIFYIQLLINILHNGLPCFFINIQIMCHHVEHATATLLVQVVPVRLVNHRLGNKNRWSCDRIKYRREHLTSSSRTSM